MTAPLGTPELRRERPVIRLFGPLTIEIEDRVLGPRDLGGTRPKHVLEVLLSARGHPVPTDRLAELLWGQERPQNAHGSIQTFVSVLRRTLVSDREWARELVVTETEAYRFNMGLAELDLDRFDALIERARHEPSGQARRLLEEALGLVRGEVLEDEPYAAWAQDLRRSYLAAVLGAYLDAGDLALAGLDYAAALGHIEAAARLDPLSERAHRARMLALYALGRQHEALDTYRQFRSRLDQELGLEPTPEMRALQSAILRQENVRLLLPPPAAPPRHATARGAVRLLGRTSELTTLEHSVRHALDGSFSLVVLEGEPGVGKTRLLDELAANIADVRLGRGSGSPLEEHLPYVPLAAALRDALGHIEQAARPRPALARVLPELALGSTARQFGHLDALEALAELIADHAPLALLLDDLQWADSATIAAISYLQRRCAHLPLAVVAAARTEQTQAGHTVRSLPADTVIHVAPLTPAELAPLGMPDLHDRTGGNARFVMEVLANRSQGAHPPTLTQQLLAQCRAEGDDVYRVLLTASVLEQPFDPERLATLLRVDAAELAEELERLCERRILAVDGFAFRFRYTLVREALVASVSPARKRLLEKRLRRGDVESDAVHPAPASGVGEGPAGARDGWPRRHRHPRWSESAVGATLGG